MTLDKRIFLVWARHHRRSELLANRFNAVIYYVFHGRMGRFLDAPLRYMIQAWKSWSILTRERPTIIFVQNPPIFAVLIVWFYTRFFGGKYIIDSHTGAFLSSKWRWSVGLHRFLSQSALLTFVHNKSQEKIVEKWGCSYYVLYDPVVDFPDKSKFSFVGQFNAVVVSSYEADEPLDVVFETAATLPEVTFYVTGDDSRCPPTLLKIRPENCILTGYIPYEQYSALIKGADIVIDLVDNGDTLLCGAFEALSAGTPLIVSDWEILRERFPIGTVYVPNTVDGLRMGVLKAKQESSQMKVDILVLRERHQDEWKQTLSEVEMLIKGNEQL